MVADVAGGRARAYLARSALNIVAVEDVARGHLLAYRARSGRAALPAGRREPDDARGVRGDLRRRGAPGAADRGALECRLRGGVARCRGVTREPGLLVLDEVRVARWPMRFDDALARAELGYTSQPAAWALARAARWAVHGDVDFGDRRSS